MCFVFTAAYGFAQAPDHVIISEFMAGNTGTYSDQDDSYEDWIEFYNPTENAIDLTGYYLTDNLSNLTKAQLVAGSESLVVPAGGYLIIWASGKNTLYNNHVSWGLSADGESIALVDPYGTTILDSFTFPAQRADVSMGRRNETSDEWVWFTDPTPFGSNSSSTGYIGFLDPPTFSDTGGFYTVPFDLSLSAPEGVTILYTLDGSEPAAENIGGTTYTYKQSYPYSPGSLPGPLLEGQVVTYTYSGSIGIADRTSEANRFSMMSSTYHASPNSYIPNQPVKKGTVVKAKAVREGYLESNSETHTYFGFNNHYSVPVFSLTTSPENLFGYKNGIYNAGIDFDKWRCDNPSLTVNEGRPANYQRSGSEWEYPLSLELFLPGANERVTATNAGFRGQGGWSRAFPQKSLRLYFRSRYGNSTLNHTLFPDSEESQFSRIILRNWGNDHQHGLIRDAAVQRTVRRLRFETQKSQPVAAYINGEYWGILDAKTRYDTKYFEREYGIPEDDLELLENDAEINEGSSNTHYLTMRNFIRDNDMSVAESYSHVQTLMDVENFIDYQLTEIYFGNIDWPQNNIRYYRKKTAAYEPNAPLNHDGRWRWLLYDIDQTMELFNASTADLNSLERAINYNSPWVSVILKNLLDNADFKKSFIVRYADLLNVVFNAEEVNKSIAYYEDILRPEISEHRTRWRNSTVSTWNSQLNVMKNYANRRQSHTRAHLRDQFSLSSEQQLNLTVVNAEGKAYVQVNTLHLAPGEAGIDEEVTEWSGLYYPDYPVMLTAHAQPGKRFAHWEGDVSSTSTTIRITLAGTTNVQAIFEDEVAPDLLHYWHFNGVNDYFNNIAADYTLSGLDPGVVMYAGKDGAVLEGENGGMDGTNTSSGSTLNVVEGYISGRALRLRNPSNEKELIFKLPSQGYRNLKLAYATHRTNNGAQTQRLLYTTNYVAASSGARTASTEWHALGEAINVPTAFELVSLALPSDVYGSDNFAFKVQFEGSNASDPSEGNNRFDNFTFHGTYDAPLPARLIAFEVGRESHTAVLQWRTAEEVGFNRFEIAHSTDGDAWNKAGEIMAKGGRGPNDYRFTVALQDRRNYYRLKMIDDDGSISYSVIKTLLYAPPVAKELILAPNPAISGRFMINYDFDEGKDYSIMVFSLSGTEVYRNDLITSSEVNLENLNPGIYLLKLTDSSGETGTQRIVID